VAEFELIQTTQFGQVLRFFEFEWRGETLHVAVVQPWENRAWLPLDEDEYPNGPRELTTMVHRLQALDVRGLRHVAGRVPLSDGSNVHVIFETSLGSLLPEMFETT
jgi:hypothetical protein